MKSESLVFAIAGVFLGLIAGWIIGSQQTVSLRTGSQTAVAGTAQSEAPAASSATAPRLDEAHVDSLRLMADRNPRDEKTRVELGNAYFDAERYAEAITWYEAALKLNPNDPNVSTDLGVSYYYTNQADRALRQFEHSLKVSPGHVKTIFNMGIVMAFGKQDLEGAAKAWRQVLELAPDSADGRAAKQALDNIRSAHPELDTQPSGNR